MRIYSNKPETFLQVVVHNTSTIPDFLSVCLEFEAGDWHHDGVISFISNMLMLSKPIDAVSALLL